MELITRLFAKAALNRALLIGVAGWIYWLWMSLQFGSFLMFVLAFLGPVGMIAALLGLWSLAFGAPLWLVHLAAH
jgi:hypothetical protein